MRMSKSMARNLGIECSSYLVYQMSAYQSLEIGKDIKTVLSII